MMRGSQLGQMTKYVFSSVVQNKGELIGILIDGRGEQTRKWVGVKNILRSRE